MSAESSALKQRITEDMKTAMKAGDKDRLGTIRLILSAVKQVEVDTRKDLSDDEILVILDKMTKQRRESILAFESAGRDDLAMIEKSELAIIQTYLPEQLTAEEIAAMIEAAIESTGASSIRDMGKVMGQLKPKLQGRADVGKVSGQIKARLNG